VADDGNTVARSAVERRRRSLSRGWSIALEALERGANQKGTELAPLLDYLAERELRTVVEIGTQHGGTFYAWCQIAAPDAVVVSIDLPGGAFGGGYSEDDIERFRTYGQAEQELHFLRLDSHDPSTLARLKEILAGERIDFLFIDGDHTYYGVRKDVEMYAPLVADGGLIALHDILPHPEVREVKVDVLWQELARDYEHVEFVDRDDDRGFGPWGGIGVLVNAAVARRVPARLPRSVRAALMEDVARARSETLAARAELSQLHQRHEALRGTVGQLEASLRALEEERNTSLRALERERDASVRALEEERDASVGAIEQERDSLHSAYESLRAAHAELQQDREAVEGSRAALERERDALASEHASLRAAYEDLRRQREALEAAREELRAQLQAELDQLQGELDGLRGERDELRADLAELRDRLARAESRADAAALDLVRERDEARREIATLQGANGEVDRARIRAERERRAAQRVVEMVFNDLEQEGARAEEERARAEQERQEAAARIAALEAEVAAGRRAQEFLQIVFATRGWRLLEKYRRVVNALRRIWRRQPAPQLAEEAPAPEPAVAAPEEQPQPPEPAPAVREPPDPERIVFGRTNKPTASVVVPAFNNVGVTLTCLAALAENTPHELLEVIVVDDGSTDETPDALARTTGVTAIRNERNVGFTEASNRGAAASTGKYVVFLNNDVVVQPGWLEALLDAAESAPDVGAVGSKLLYPDGTLQEAGGVVWSNGGAWNFGRGRDPEAPEFNYRREVDYCSAASLLVRRDVLERVGYFDTLFSPAYCEDTDLCFAIRDAGYRVLFEPRSVVVHDEGTSHGSDERPAMEGTSHTKSSQYRNQAVFAEKWRDELARQRPDGTKLGYLGGRVERRPRVLVADMWIPAYDKDSGSRRMTWILTNLRDLGCAVTYFNTDRQRVEPYVSLLQSLGVEVYYGPQSFTEFAEQRSDQFDLVFLSRPNVALPLLDDVHRYFPLAPIVYDMSDAMFVREQRKLDVLGSGVAPADIERIREEELTCVRRSDVTTGPSQVDVDVMREHVPDGRFFVLPNAHELDDEPPRPFEKRRDLVFIGGFNHDPNVDSALWLVNEIMPLVAEEIDARVWLLGSHPPEAVQELASADVLVPGYLPEEDVAQRFREGRVFVSPLRYGAGIKGKIGHAMAFRLPIVTTSIGAEGMEFVDGENALIRESTEEFARAIVDVYRDRELWERMSRASYEIVAERWTPEAMRGRLERLLQETLGVKVRSLAPARP
jgi:GT2 family glycosyltransferase/glycosyltransferase involved in cell wall biosynthesis/cephalosporin hydroxylase/predicted  nucleic acid-binding Zn-ribbon protein